MNKLKIIFDPSVTEENDNIGSYLKSSDGTLLTHTDVGGKKSLDVNVANTVTISATDLDIRDLTHVSDSVKVGDGTDFLAINADGSVNITDNGGSLTVDATNLDIRDLDHAQDDVAIAQGGNTMVVNADGSINVNADISMTTGFEKAEDAAHSSGDIGAYMLSVREDSLASSTSATGDYQSFKTDALGRLYTNRSAQSAAYGATSVTDTATDIVPTDLANRSRILIQNNSGNRNVFLGSNASVTDVNGTKLPPGSSVEFEAGAAVNLHAICSAGQTADVRYFELA